MEWKYVLESKRNLEERTRSSNLAEIVVSVFVVEGRVNATALEAMPKEANPVS